MCQEFTPGGRDLATPGDYIGPDRVSPTASPGSANRRAGEETLRARPPDRHAAGPEASPRLASRLAATPALRRNGDWPVHSDLVDLRSSPISTQNAARRTKSATCCLVRVGFFPQAARSAQCPPWYAPGMCGKRAVTPRAVKRTGCALQPADNAVYLVQRSVATAAD